MRRARVIAALIIGGALFASCAASPRAVLGQESAGGGWDVRTSSASVGSSSVEYLGASADGKVIVRRDGRVEIWNSR